MAFDHLSRLNDFHHLLRCRECFRYLLATRVATAANSVAALDAVVAPTVGNPRNLVHTYCKATDDAQLITTSLRQAIPRPTAS